MKLVIPAFLLTLFFLVSCEKENENVAEEISLTEQVDKIETIYESGDVKLENYCEGDKTETSVGFDYKDKIRYELENSFSKNQTYLKNSGKLVGVFKSGTCGSYQVLDVFMDCEDRNSQSSKSGWTGDSYVDGNDNVHLLFCVVSGAYFERTNDKVYGVLRLYSGSPSPNSFFRRYFDNEDKNNVNSAKLDGVKISGVYGFCKFEGNDLLSFYYYPQTTQSKSFPSIGISYGVLGTFGTTNGSIYTDDEDDDNANWATVDEYNDATYSYKPYYYIDNINFNGLMSVGSNTRFYISKVN